MVLSVILSITSFPLEALKSFLSVLYEAFTIVLLFSIEYSPFVLEKSKT